MAYRAILADTSALYALIDADDAHHDAAARYWKSLAPGTVVVVAETTLMETMTLVQARLGHAVAARALDAIQRSERYRVAPLTEEDRLAAWRIFAQYADKEWSPFDCAMLALAQRRGIQEAFAFDSHFHQMAVAGLVRVPPR